MVQDLFVCETESLDASEAEDFVPDPVTMSAFPFGVVSTIDLNGQTSVGMEEVEVPARNRVLEDPAT